MLLPSSTAEQLSHPLTAVFLLFGAGVAWSFTPCIYPMIPITVSLLSGSATAGASRRRVVALTLTYVVGLSLVYATLGLLAGLSGSLFGTVSSNKWVLLATGNIFLLVALAMLDVIPVAAPQRLLQWAGNLGGGSYPSVFLLGATSGIVAAPCGAPAFAAILTWVAATRSGVLGFIYLFVFALGMSALLVAIGLSSGVVASLPRAGGWMVWVKRAGGIILLGVTEYYFIQAGQVW
jgi:thiol:disulfide interchange protein DsbD